jgi:hypothetical protein
MGWLSLAYLPFSMESIPFRKILSPAHQVAMLIPVIRSTLIPERWGDRRGRSWTRQAALA